MRRFRALRSGLSTISELFTSVWQGPERWLVAALVLLLPLAALLVIVQSVPAVAPFVYTLF